MAGSRVPGPIGLDPQVHTLNDGTMFRGLAPRPGPIGLGNAAGDKTDSAPSDHRLRARVSRDQSSRVRLPVLRQGSRNQEVQRLQQLLNSRISPSPRLALDAHFGPLTTQAVLQYQRSVSIGTDGVVGKQTWYELLKGNGASEPVSASAGPAARPPTLGIWEWPLQAKFAEALRRTASQLPSSMRHEFMSLLSPMNLGVMGGTLVVWAGSHAFGVGEAIDLVLLAGGVFFLGVAAFDVADDLGDFLVMASTAASDKDLNAAATHLANAVAILGVAAFAALVAKVGRTGGSRETLGGSEPSIRRAREGPAVKGVSRQTPLETTSQPGKKAPLHSSSALTKQQLSDWYRAQGEYFNNPKNLGNHLEGTDFTKSIELKVLPKDTELIMYVRSEGTPGMYFARPGTPMESLGIREPPPRVLREFVVTEPIEVVESTAASIEADLAPGVGGTGGGQQLILPRGWENSVTSMPGGR